MEGFHFFLEFPDQKARRKATRKNITGHSGTVIAVTAPRVWVPGPGMCMEAFSAVQDIPNGPVCYASCSQDYLRERCLRISKQVAREIHPNLFKRIDD